MLLDRPDLTSPLILFRSIDVSGLDASVMHSYTEKNGNRPAAATTCTCSREEAGMVIGGGPSAILIRFVEGLKSPL
ncbi:hypothetical protein TWF594_001118 [Orbilia oligospora]|uniref:Uncharacterized protein n=1 Tax=Orbilia oligospora TaxID=2813651 RepID=A0A7C8JRN0_ORBOL|nr:hypothetical protein TWF103_003664 [Orbilia oligospora]KAF3126409.1 hypothetical protein TWF594_001118 [Orbilia oligospora]KAF3141777.1 hypothetical protein TWF703_001799 [Orbilia oligospora]